ncbi:MAG: RNA polymerase sigma factor [Oscillospiraceae bacterium]
MDDSKIIGLYLERSEQAIPATSQKYGKYCFTIAKNILGNSEDSEECVNDTYMKVWNAIPPKIPTVFSAFIAKITRNLSLNRYNKNTSEKRGKGESALVLDELGDIVSGRESVEGETDSKELIKEINAFLGSIDKEKRDIFVCRYFYFDPVSDIAKRFDKTDNSVSVTLNRLRTKLKEYLTERGFEI